MSIPLNNIDAIIFDLGGVLWNIRYEVLIDSFRKIGMEHFEKHFAKAQQEQLFDQFEKGQISSSDFCQRILLSCKPGTTEPQVIDAWNSMLFDLPAERVELLKQLKSTYRTFLLSNTNRIHVEWLYQELQKHYNISDFSSLFEHVYLSNEMGKRKPDAEIFQQVLTEQGLVPERTVFIDDSIQHVESARKLGIQAVHLDVSQHTVLDLFSARD